MSSGIHINAKSQFFPAQCYSPNLSVLLIVWLIGVDSLVFCHKGFQGCRVSEYVCVFCACQFKLDYQYECVSA